MSELLLSKNALNHTRDLIKSTPHAVLVCGEQGSGKRSCAEYIVSEILKIPVANLLEYPYFYLVDKPDNKQEIPIESIREVIRNLRLKTPLGNKKITRAVLIENSDSMSHEAQNAILKMIEEPPQDTVFVLTATSETSVLPTIASRAQKLKIGPVSLKEAFDFFSNNYTEPMIESAWRLSGGHTGLLTALLNEDKEHPLKKAVEQAKELLKMSKYERILLLDKLSSNKTDLITLLEAIERVLTALNHSSITKNKMSGNLLRARKQVNFAIQRLNSSTSTKLIAMDLAINLPV